MNRCCLPPQDHLPWKWLALSDDNTEDKCPMWRRPSYGNFCDLRVYQWCGQPHASPWGSKIYGQSQLLKLQWILIMQSINIKQMHFTNRFCIFITILFHYNTLQFLAHTLGFAEAQHSTNTGIHMVLLCLDVGRTFSAVIEDWRREFDMWRRSTIIGMLRWWLQWWGWWKMLGWWVMMGGDAPHQFLVWQQFWHEWPKKEVSPYTVNSEDTFEHLRWRLN